MTTEDVKKMLNDYRDTGIYCSALENEVELWKARAEDTNADIAKPAAEYIDLMDILRDNILQLAKQRLNCFALIESIDDVRLKSLLHLRYIEGLTWEKVSEQLYIDYRWCFRLHKQAIDLIATKAQAMPC